MPISPLYSNLAKITTKMTKSGVYLPVILLEGTVVAGRTYHAYKRGGMTEARERVLEESTGSLVWLGGAPLLEKIGNYVGKRFAGIKTPNFDIGRDNLRNPLDYVVNATKDASKMKYTRFKFANTILSIGLASAFLGFVVPKINHRITNLLNNSAKKPTYKDNKTTPVQKNEPLPKIVVPTVKKPLNSNKFKTIDSFLKNSTKTNNKITFKGIISPEALATLTHNLATNPIYKLGTTDTGILAGRASNARNGDEAREIIFRDGASSFFYLGAQPLMIASLIKLDNKLIKGNTAIDAYSAMNIQKMLVDGMPQEKMSIAAFSDYALGKFNKDLFEKLKFDTNDIISLKAFNEVISDTKLQEKALEMSKLQPQKSGISVLTKQQAQNVLTDGKITDPKFLKSILNSIFGKLDGSEDVLCDPTRFIPRKDIEKSTKNIEKFTQSVLEYAKKHNITEITPDVIMSVSKRNLYHNLGFMAAGFGVAALFLSTVIPKMQYLITKMRTGSNEFPGAKDLQNPQ